MPYETARVSVIVPVYNAEQYLEKCVSSIVEQTHRNLEIILIDDGSVDRSAELCDAWAERDARIQVIHQKNAGPAAARNAGLDRVTGEFISFVDSDDWLDVQFCEKMLDAMDSAGNITVVQCGMDMKNDCILFESDDTIPHDKIMPEFVLSRRISVYLTNKIYRREIWNGIRIPDQHYAENSSVLLKILHKSQQVRLISYVGYQYRTDNISITRSTKGPKVWHGYLEEARSYEAMFRENYPELTGYADEKFCTRAQYGIADLWKNHTISKAERRYWRREFLGNFKKHWPSYRNSEVFRARRASRRIGTTLFSVAPDLYVYLWPIAAKIFH